MKQKLNKGSIVMFKGTPLELLADVEVESEVDLPPVDDSEDLDDEFDDFDDDPEDDDFDDEDDDI